MHTGVLFSGLKGQSWGARWGWRFHWKRRRWSQTTKRGFQDASATWRVSAGNGLVCKWTQMFEHDGYIVGGERTQQKVFWWEIFVVHYWLCSFYAIHCEYQIFFVSIGNEELIRPNQHAYQPQWEGRCRDRVHIHPQLVLSRPSIRKSRRCCHVFALLPLGTHMINCTLVLFQ